MNLTLGQKLVVVEKDGIIHLIPQVSSVKLDVDQNREFSNENRVTGVPSVFVFSEGKRVVFDDGRGNKIDRLVGVMPEEVYTQIIEELLAEA